MYQSIILPLAKQDIKEAAHWYNAKQKGLGKKFTSLVREKVKFIRQNPAASAIRYDGVRTAVLDVFPFMIHYSVDDAQRLIVVSAVLHTSRNPQIWKDKI